GARAIRTIRAAASPGRGPPTVITALATDRPRAGWSIRWWLIRPASAAGTGSAITTTGSRSSAACAMPLTALASPGPRVTTTAPARAGETGAGGRQDRGGGLAAGQDEAQPGRRRRADHVQVGAAARHAEHQPRARPGQRRYDRIGSRVGRDGVRRGAGGA